jgi:acyl carrier protein
MGMREGEVQQRLQAFVTSEFAANRQRGSVGLDDALLTEGILDSMGVMQVVSFVEETFGIVVDDRDIVPENFQSLRAIADLVVAKGNGSAPQPS